MCGIYGSTIYYDDETVKAKVGRINFRGPDHTGFERLGNVILGHNRLAIVDLDHRSDQPFTYQHLKIVFNGEIYNFQSLKTELQNHGHVFYTDSDTEVLAVAYLHYGPRCIDLFNGMFAFVVYDTKEQVLFGGRDRLGKKPFYYAHQGTNFEFASQPSQIIINRKVSRDEQAINAYFVWGYIPEPHTAWNEIKKLPAGHVFTYSIASGEFSIRKYWDLDPHELSSYQGSYDSAKLKLKHLLKDAVTTRMYADVDLGIFLSGGIDSSLVASIAAENSKQVKTFCIKFKEKDFDESIFAAKIAAHLHTDHHEIECHTDEGLALIDSFGRYFDEPFADSSAIPTLLLSKYTKQHVTVVLSGDGGDEGFFGYSRYRWLNQANMLFNLPYSLRKVLGSIIQLSQNYRYKLIGMGVSLEKIETLYALMLGGLEYSWLEKPYSGLNVPFMEILSSVSPGSFLQKMSAFDIKTYLNGDINTKVDRASMAFAIEARAPLMDYRVITFAHQLPDEYKYHNGIQKRILKDILYENVPAQLFNRPKSGFTMPFSSWFRHELKEYVMDNLCEHELKSLPGINVSKTMAMINAHMTGKWNRFPQIWKLLVLKQWLDNQKNTPQPLHQVA